MTTATAALKRMYIDGKWCEAANGGTLGVINPATEEVITEVAYGGRSEAKRALEAAAKAMPGWMKQTAWDRAKILKKTAELHQILGNKFLICPSLSGKTAEAWTELAKKFNDIAARAKELGMLVGYHSHASDFKTKFDGKPAWEIFFDNTNAEVVHQQHGDVAAGLDDAVQWAAVDDEVFDDREGGRPERLDDDLLAVVEGPQVQLAGRRAALRAVRLAVDHQSARAADALAAVAVERDGPFAAAHQALVQQIERFQQRAIARQVRKRVAGRVVRPGNAEVKRARKRHIEGECGEMQWIDAGETTPDETADRLGIGDAAEILPGDDEAGDDKEQIDEEIEMPGMLDHEMAGREVLEVIGIVQNHHGSGRDDSQSIQMPGAAGGVLQGRGTPDSNFLGRAKGQAARPAIRLTTVSRSLRARSFQRARFRSASAT